ncbi:MAG: YhbY family RNA-binding protein [Chloroflexi bacterium OHK40]
MTLLTRAQRSYLRKLANPLKPTVMLGRQGLTEPLLAKVVAELAAHELIKVRLLEHKDQREQLASTLIEETGAALVGIVGNVITLYLPSADPARRVIVLPRGDGGAVDSDEE